MIDRYTKAVLTVIAIALSTIAVQQVVGPARAQLGTECGSRITPCFVTTHLPIGVRVFP